MGAKAKSAEKVVPRTPSLPDEVDELETKLIEQALKRHGGNLRQAAAYLGVSRTGLYKKISRLGIEYTAYRIQE